MPRTLVLTNDFPPRRGGIEMFVANLADRIGDVVVYTSHEPGDVEADAALPYPVVRDRTRMLLPTRRVREAVLRTFAEHGCDRVLIGSSVPLGLLAPALREAGAEKIVAITHGHEVWWSMLPGTRGALRKVGDSVDWLTDISDWTRAKIGRALSETGRSRQARMAAGADVERFHPGAGGAAIRERLGLTGDTPAVVCGARVIKRKGQDLLVDAWPRVLRDLPEARLVIVGDGSFLPALRKRVRARGLESSVTLVGSVPWTEMPAWIDAANVFAMPSRSRWFGLEPEGLPLAFVEAAACGKPTIVGRSGGAPEAIVDGVTGYVVDPRDAGDVAHRILELLRDPDRARAMGEAGMERARADWRWDQVAATCRRLLDLPEA